MKLYVMSINGTIQGIFASLEQAAQAFESCVFDLPGGLEMMRGTAEAVGLPHIECRIATCRYVKLLDGKESYVNAGNESVTQITFDGKQVPPPEGARITLEPNAPNPFDPDSLDKTKLN